MILSERKKPKTLGDRKTIDYKKARNETRKFLSVLEDRIVKLSKSSVTISELPEEGTFQEYLKFRSMMEASVGFSIIIERRLDQLRGDTESELRRMYDKLTVGLWTLLLTSALEFLEILADQEFLPLGSRDVFMCELKTLYEARTVLKRERYGDLVSDGLWRRLETSERILDEVIDRAPSLLALD